VNAENSAAVSLTRTVVVIGHGMVGHKLVQSLHQRDADASWQVVVFGEERQPAYDRVHLSSLFDGVTAEGLGLAPAHSERVVIRSGERVVAIDRAARTVTTDGGRVQAYDAAVLATGSVAFVPPVPGRDRPGCFVYRTIDDVDAIRAWSAGRRRGVVIGGGLLGLEAANALRCCGLDVEVIELAPRLMPVQVDDAGGALLRARIEELDVRVTTGAMVVAVEGALDAAQAHDGAAVGAVVVRSGDAEERHPADIVVFAAGIRPRDDLARACGLAVGPRGGVVVDEHCQTSDPAIYAIGECALAQGQIYGLVGPGYQMARVVAETLCGGDAAFGGADLSTKLKLLGVDVASFGDAHASSPGAQTITLTDVPARIHKRLVLDGAGRVIGGVLVGDASAYETLAQMARGDLPTPAEPVTLLASGSSGVEPLGIGALPDGATICTCENVTKGAISDAVATCVAATGTAELGRVKAACGAGTGCGGCVPQLQALLRHELERVGLAVDNRLCEHFAYTRQELFDIVRVERIPTFAALLASRGTGLGCEICRPVVASILASLDQGYILDEAQAALQDSNDHFLANLQRDGTYSVVPRIPGGEITPERLIIIGEVARDFGLYTKITGGQRIDLFGARVEQLPAIWRRLVAAGMESGHAYGKALRTVKSCVGQTWCRFGVQDSTTMAIDLELRYRGLRSPHKLKMAVSGCARECAEAQSKDVGVIATDRGWNLYVGGNGGTRPRHADLLATDLDDETLVRTIDRFLMLYIRTADRLQRTSTWLEQLDGGVEYLRAVLIDDRLGLGDELDAAMERHVASYRCEWAETLDRPDRLALFRSFVNTDEADPDITFVTERDQPRPARGWQPVSLGRSHS
jgi:nitrite reductase (NADH) large subunit